MVAPYSPYNVCSMGNVLVRSDSKDEQSIKSIIEQNLEQKRFWALRRVRKLSIVPSLLFPLAQ